MVPQLKKSLTLISQLFGDNYKVIPNSNRPRSRIQNVKMALMSVKTQRSNNMQGVHLQRILPLTKDHQECDRHRLP